MANYLRECLGRHGDVTRALYGKRQELREIERRASGIIESGRLSYDDVATIIHAQFWRGGTFWQWPTREEFNERCEGDAVEGLSVLPKRENAIVDRLLRIFRHIEPVSVVMRFVAPRNFGILSPPVEKLLEIGPAHKPREKYRKYVKDLRTLRDERGFDTAAEVDMALWVMREIIDARHSRSEWLEPAVPECDSWIDAFWADRTLREIRVRNLSESLFGTMTMAEFAEALLPGALRRPKHDQVMLAGRIAGIEFEQAVIQVAQALRPRGHGDQRTPDSLMSVVRSLQVPAETRDRWIRAVRIRNVAVHGEKIQRDEVDQLLGAMRDALEWAAELTMARGPGVGSARNPVRSEAHAGREGPMHTPAASPTPCRRRPPGPASTRES